MDGKRGCTCVYTPSTHPPSHMHIYGRRSPNRGGQLVREDSHPHKAASGCIGRAARVPAPPGIQQTLLTCEPPSYTFQQRSRPSTGSGRLLFKLSWRAMHVPIPKPKPKPKPED
eukprot:366573-Chlamydomonas_euryale.AAC.27